MELFACGDWLVRKGLASAIHCQAMHVKSLILTVSWYSFRMIFGFCDID